MKFMEVLFVFIWASVNAPDAGQFYDHEMMLKIKELYEKSVADGTLMDSDFLRLC